MIATLEYTTQSGEVYRRDVGGMENDTTNNRLTLLGILEALERLRTNCDITIVTSCEFVANTIQADRLPQWEKNGWKTVKGEDVTHADLWQQLLKYTRQHLITVEKTTHEPGFPGIKFKIIEEAGGYKAGEPVTYECPDHLSNKIRRGSGTIYGFSCTWEGKVDVWVQTETGEIVSGGAECIRKATN